MFDLLADHVQRALEARAPVGVCSRGAFAVRSVSDEQLLDDRLTRAGGRAKPGVVSRHDAPAKDFVSVVLNGPLDQRPQSIPIVPAFRQKDEARSVLSRRREREPEGRGDLAQESIGRLNENAGAIARVGLASARAAVQQIEQNLQPLVDDAVRLAALDVDDEANAARVVLVGRVVKAGGGHGPAVIPDREAQVKYNDLIESIRCGNGFLCSVAGNVTMTGLTMTDT